LIRFGGIFTIGSTYLFCKEISCLNAGKKIHQKTQGRKILKIGQGMGDWYKTDREKKDK